MKVNIGPYEDNRKIEIEYHPYDTWNLDDTLARIILPGLIQLKETNHGFPHVTRSRLEKHNIHSMPSEIDSATEEAWEWVQNEMIWAFSEVIEPLESKFRSGETDFLHIPLKHGGYELKEGPNHTYKVDKEGLEKHTQRVKDGLLLFGLFFRNLWD